MKSRTNRRIRAHKGYLLRVYYFFTVVVWISNKDRWSFEGDTTTTRVKPFELNVVMKLLHLISGWFHTRILKDINDAYDGEIGQGITVAIISSHCNNRFSDDTKQFDAGEKIVLTISNNVAIFLYSFKSKQTLFI